ncbi:hypothetical protein Nepgr_003912 [Nepenthes gracilis]|uniref:Uncharacterized protein n=1 Tax=Nepenthes gracilis TaxID=150966 RepID=A0AAD3S0H6_NEPGR|nr:hypothetical protein Nepgr_003912 [Nepenthes gracilis]
MEQPQPEVPKFSNRREYKAAATNNRDLSANVVPEKCAKKQPACNQIRPPTNREIHRAQRSNQSKDPNIKSCQWSIYAPTPINRTSKEIQQEEETPAAHKPRAAETIKNEQLKILPIYQTR